MFLKAHSFPWAMFSETVHFLEQIMTTDQYATIILSQMEAVMFISFKYVLTHLKLWKLRNITSPVLAGEYSVMWHIVSGGRLSPWTNYVLHNLTNLAHAKMLELWIISLHISPWTLSFHWSSQFSWAWLLKSVCFSEQIMLADNYPSIYVLHQMESIVYVYCALHGPKFSSADIMCLPLLQPILPYCAVSHTMSSFCFQSGPGIFLLENYQGVLKWFCHQSSFW